MSDVTQTSFNAGELSPKIYGRPKLAKYENGLKEMYNMIALVEGPATRRPGTEFIARQYHHDKKTVLYDYEFSTEQAYTLEFGENYIRFFKDGGPIIEKTATITGATKANPVVISAVNTFVNGEVVRISGVKGMTELNEEEFIVTNASGTDFELTGIDGTSYTTYVSGGDADKPYVVVTTYSEAELPNLDFSSLNDVISIAHFNHAPAELTRSSHVSWALANISFTAGPSEWGAADYPKFVTFDNERRWWGGSPSYPMRLWGSKTGIYDDHGVHSPLVADDALQLDLATNQANAIQWMASSRKFAIGTTGAEFWLANSTGDGPITPLSKQSVPGSFNGTSIVKPLMIGGTLLYLQRQSKKLRELIYEWSADAFQGKDLIVLAQHLTQGYTITDMAFQREPYQLLWCVRSDGVLLSMTYYPDQEVVGWHKHDIGGDVESVAVISGATEDEVWLSVKRTVNGSTVRYIERIHSSFDEADTVDAFFVDSGLTLDNRQTVGSITHATPGVINLTSHGYSNGDIVTFRSIDDDVDGEDDYLSIHRERWTVANKTDHTFEMTDEDVAAVDLSGYKQVESCTVALNQTVITGLAHLEGEEVTILADGAPVAEKTVANSQITLDTQASVAHIGVGSYAQIQTLPPFLQTSRGDNFAKMQRVTNLVIQLYKTLGMQYSNEDGNFSDYDFISDEVPVGQAGELFNGFTEDISFDGEYSRDPSVYIRQPQPLPITILSIYTEFEGES